MGGSGTSTGTITVGVARRLTSWWPGGSTSLTPSNARAAAGLRSVRNSSTAWFGSRSRLRRRRRSRACSPAPMPGVEKIACST